MLLCLTVYAFLVIRLSLGEQCLDDQHCRSCRSGRGDCITGCYDGYYGSKCDLSCRPNCRNGRCKLGRKGIEVCTDGCNPGYYGTRCTQTCDTPEDGCKVCPGGCESGFCQLESMCVSNCSGSHFGKACKLCHDECNVCNKSTGTCEDCPNCLGKDCSEGCKEGCIQGYYKKNCEGKCSDHCILGCDQASGHCASCRAGWYGSLCHLECSPGCLVSCVQNGSCMNGCERGLYGEKCNMSCPINCFNNHCLRDGTCNVCIDGFYGRECKTSCQNCDGVCDKDSGICRRCKEYFTGSGCLQDCQQNCSRPGCEVYRLCKAHKDEGPGPTEVNYVPYYAVGAMMLVVLCLSTYVVLRLKRINFLVYGRAKSPRQQPEPYFQAENNLYTAVTHSYYELNEEEMNTDRQSPASGAASTGERSLAAHFDAKPNLMSDPNPDADHGRTTNPDNDEMLNIGDPVLPERFERFTDMGRKYKSQIYYSQYLTCVPETSTRENCTAFRHDTSVPISRCEVNNSKMRANSI